MRPLGLCCSWCTSPVVLCSGIELTWGIVLGLADAMATPFATSNYTRELVPNTFDLVQRFRGGDALFAAPRSPIKCGPLPPSRLSDGLERAATRFALSADK